MDEQSKTAKALLDDIQSYIETYHQTILHESDYFSIDLADANRQIRIIIFTEKQRPMPQLSPRECQVAQLIAKGYSNKRIARRLQISYNTVKTYIQRIFVKLGVQSRAEMATQVIQYGLVDSL